MKRVAIFSTTYDPFIGGAEVAIKEITNRLSDFEFDLFTAKFDSDLPDEERMGNVNVYRVGSGRPFLDKLFYPCRASRLALKLHSQKPYDLVHAFMANYAGLAALLFKKKHASIPYILTLQSGDSDLFIWMRTWFWYPLYRQIYTKADKITAISRWLANRARKHGYKKEISIIPNGVDVEKFDIEISDEERLSVRKSWGANGKDFVAITASRLVYKNGIDILINAMEYLSDNVKLVIAGKGRDEKELRTRAEKFGDRIIFLGHVGHDKLPRLLKSSDVFARPSRSEGMGNSFVEAKAAGLPVIGTNVGGVKDLIHDKIVISVKRDDSEDVAEKIQSLVEAMRERPDIYREKARAAIDIVKSQYYWDFIAQQYMQEYKKLLTQKHVPKNQTIS